MRRRANKPSFAAASTGPLLGIAGLVAIWIAVQFDLHNAAGRVLVGFLVPN